jgi:iron complex transport system permease protein
MKRPAIFIILLFLLLLVIIISLISGSATDLTAEGLVSVLLGRSDNPLLNAIIWDLRIPRIITGMVVGAALSACGVIFQAVLRNPLAEPYTLGVSSGGALGATISIMMGLSAAAMVGMCFLGCLLTILLILGLASIKGFSNTMLILCGVIIGFLLSSIMMLLFSLSTSRDVYASVMWLMGSLSAPSKDSVRIMVYFVLPLVLASNLFLRDLNILSLGDEKAMYLGLNAKSARAILFFISSLITGACVAVAGVISFVGLIIPHIMRKVVGPDHSLLLPSSMLAGAALLVLSDTVARTVISPLELPVGVITGIMGGLFFLFMILWHGEDIS